MIRFPSQKSSLGWANFNSPLISANAVVAFSNNLSNRPKSKAEFLEKMTVLLEIYFKKLSRFSSKCLFSTLGKILIFFSFSVDNCVSISKVRILSTSSPKNSTLYGWSFENENTSTIPPRTANSPGSVTKSTRLKLYSNNTSLTKSSEICSPTVNFSVFFSNSRLVTTFSKSASG